MGVESDDLHNWQLRPCQTPNNIKLWLWKNYHLETVTSLETAWRWMTLMHRMGRRQPRDYANCLVVPYSHINNLYPSLPHHGSLQVRLGLLVYNMGWRIIFCLLDLLYCPQSLALTTQMNAEETMTLSTCFHRSWVAAILVKCTRLVIGRLADTKSSLFAS